MPGFRILLGTLLCSLVGSTAHAGIFDNWVSHDGCCDDSCVSDSCLDDCVDGCTGFEGDDSLLGNWLNKSDHCFDDFISPMTNPVYFEDPRSLTELRGIYLHQGIPSGVGGGEINLLAAQIRVAVNENFSIIANKDGYYTSSSPLIDDGWADVGLGGKFTFFRDPCQGKIAAAGVTYEMPVGSTRAAQGNGAGEFNLFLSGGQRLGSYMHYMAAGGLRLPADSAAESKSFYLSQHLDYMVSEKVYLLTELNWFGWFQGGNAGVPGAPTVEGGDLINLGAPDVAGNNIITMAWGAKFKPSGNCEIGLAYEVPLSSRNDLLDNRLTADVILRY